MDRIRSKSFFRAVSGGYLVQNNLYLSCCSPRRFPAFGAAAFLQIFGTIAMNAFRTVVLAALLLPTTLRTVAAGPLDRVRDSFVRVSALSYAPDEEITDRFIRYSDYGRANDVLLLQLYMSVHLPDAEVRRLLGLFDAGGFWRDAGSVAAVASPDADVRPGETLRRSRLRMARR